MIELTSTRSIKCFIGLQPHYGNPNVVEPFPIMPRYLSISSRSAPTLGRVVVFFAGSHLISLIDSPPFRTRYRMKFTLSLGL